MSHCSKQKTRLKVGWRQRHLTAESLNNTMSVCVNSYDSWIFCVVLCIVSHLFSLLFLPGYLWKTFPLGRGQNQRCHLQATWGFPKGPTVHRLAWHLWLWELQQKQVGVHSSSPDIRALLLQFLDKGHIVKLTKILPSFCPLGFVELLQLWAAVHQLRQWAVAAVLRQAYFQAGAGGVHPWKHCLEAHWLQRQPKHPGCIGQQTSEHAGAYWWGEQLPQGPHAPSIS